MADAPTIGRKGVPPSAVIAAFLRRYAALTALIVLLAFNFAVTPNFASWQTLNVNLTQVATIVIVSVGMTLVIATVGIDLSVGSLMAISVALAPLIFLSPFGHAYPALGNALAFVVPVIVAGLFGLFNGWFITRFPESSRSSARWSCSSPAAASDSPDQRQSAGVQRPPRFQFVGLGAGGRRALSGYHHAGAGRGRRVDSALDPVRSADPVGRRERARAARLSGVPVATVKRSVYAISGLCAGIAGLVVVSINSSSDANLVGLGMELDAIAADAVGGTPFTGGRGDRGQKYRRGALAQFSSCAILCSPNGVPDAAALVVKGAIIASAVWSQQRGKST